MLAKIWKKIGLVILIIACLWNIILKINLQNKKKYVRIEKDFFN